MAAVKVANVDAQENQMKHGANVVYAVLRFSAIERGGQARLREDVSRMLSPRAK